MNENPYAGINISTVRSLLNLCGTRPELGNVGFGSPEPDSLHWSLPPVCGLAPEVEVSSLLVFLLSFLILFLIYFLGFLA